MNFQTLLINQVKQMPPDLLEQAFHYLSSLAKAKHNRKPGWKLFCGKLQEDSAEEMKKIIEHEFEKTEGEW